jgi:hypothetical protein
MIMVARKFEELAKKAAWRVISRFQNKFELFGASELRNDITLEEPTPSAF